MLKKKATHEQANFNLKVDFKTAYKGMYAMVEYCQKILICNEG